MTSTPAEPLATSSPTTSYQIRSNGSRPGFPHLCIRSSAGLSFQGHNLWYIKISDNPGLSGGEPSRRFNGATDAREPMGTHACVAFADHILSHYGIDSVTTWLVNNQEIFVVPVMNPDGYVYNSDSGGSSSDWWKNRRGPVPPYASVDLNRNYGYKWGYDDNGSSGEPSSETYRGPSCFSEPETEVIRDFMALYNLLRWTPTAMTTTICTLRAMTPPLHQNLISSRRSLIP